MDDDRIPNVGFTVDGLHPREWPDTAKFMFGERVIVINEESNVHRKVGRILGMGIDTTKTPPLHDYTVVIDDLIYGFRPEDLESYEFTRPLV